MKSEDRRALARSIPNLPDRETLLGLYERLRAQTKDAVGPTRLDIKLGT